VSNFPVFFRNHRALRDGSGKAKQLSLLVFAQERNTTESSNPEMFGETYFERREKK